MKKVTVVTRILFIVLMLIVLGCERNKQKPPRREAIVPATPKQEQQIKKQISEAEIQRVLPLIQRELDSWDDDTGDGGRWKRQKVSWNGNSFIVEIEMRSMADLRPGNPMPNSTAQNEYLKLGSNSVKKYAPEASCVVNLTFNNKVANSRSN